MEYTLGETLLKAENINLEFDKTVILRDVNIEIKNIIRPNIQQGQITGFIGPSGIGKSLFSEILTGIRQPTSGTVKVDSTQDNVKIGKIGFVQQKYPLFDHRTVLGNLEVVGELNIQDKKLRSDKINNYLERFHLSQHKKKYPAQLSGGQKQRLAICQALIASENFLILDEPFSGLDVNMVSKLTSLLVELTTQNELLTIIIISHDIVSTASISDTLWVMGRDRDANNNVIPGAKIKHYYDLMSMGLAWRKDIASDLNFVKLTNEIKSLFEHL